GKETEDIEMIARLKQHLTRDKSSWEIAAFHVPKKIREKAKEKNKTMNETMIKEIVEKDNMEKNTVNQDDKVIIETFYQDRKSTRLNSSHVSISYAVFCLKKKR